MNTILISPNAFKECAGSVETALLIEEQFKDSGFNTIVKPVSDGGDSFLEVIKFYFDIDILHINVKYPYYINNHHAGRTGPALSVPVGISSSGKTAYIESSKVLGLSLIPAGKRNPLYLSSAGMGGVLQYIRANFREIEKVVIGIGGTGTNDMGLGALKEFGLKLTDKNNQELEVIPAGFLSACRIMWNDITLPYDIELVTDVDNPLMGEKGASYTFAPQKGASPEEVKQLEAGFIHILSLLEKKGLVRDNKLSGAGGGLAAGLQIFFNAKLKSAEEFILNDLGINKIEGENLCLITGEGKFDSQTLMKKAPGILVNFFKDKAKFIFIICGSAEEKISCKLPGNVKITEMIKYFGSHEESISNFVNGIKLASGELSAILKKNFNN